MDKSNRPNAFYREAKRGECMADGRRMSSIEKVKSAGQADRRLGRIRSILSQDTASVRRSWSKHRGPPPQSSLTIYAFNTIAGLQSGSVEGTNFDVDLDVKADDSIENVTISPVLAIGSGTTLESAFQFHKRSGVISLFPRYPGGVVCVLFLEHNGRDDCRDRRSGNEPMRWRWSKKVRYQTVTRVHGLYETHQETVIPGVLCGYTPRAPDVGVRLLRENTVIKYVLSSLPNQGTSVGSSRSHWCLGPLRSEHLLEVAPNNARRLGSVNPSPKPLVLVVLDDRASLRVVGIQTLSERIDVIVGPLDQRFTSHVIGHRLLRWAALPRCQKNNLTSGNGADLNSLWYERPLAGWIRRPVIREMRRWSTIDN